MEPHAQAQNEEERDQEEMSDEALDAQFDSYNRQKEQDQEPNNAYGRKNSSNSMNRHMPLNSIESIESNLEELKLLEE